MSISILRYLGSGTEPKNYLKLELILEDCHNTAPGNWVTDSRVPCGWRVMKQGNDYKIDMQGRLAVSFPNSEQWTMKSLIIYNI